MRDIIILACEECRARNYTTTRNKRKNPNRMELKKFCPSCRRHTLHKQTR